MNEFLKLVKERPNEKHWKSNYFCPYCNNKNIIFLNGSSTLVGYGGEDMNHTCTTYHCNDCNKNFIRETKGNKNVWFTNKNNKILLGIPYCFENYIYSCKYCNGNVHIKHLNKNDNKECPCLTYVVSNEKLECLQYHMFECEKCHKNIISENYYYSFY